MSIQPKNPIIMTYQAHDSPIYSVDFSPFHRHLFLTCAHDGQVRIYSQLFVNNFFVLSYQSVDLFSQITAVVLLPHTVQSLLVVGHHHVLLCLQLEVNMVKHSSMTLNHKKKHQLVFYHPYLYKNYPHRISVHQLIV